MLFFLTFYSINLENKMDHGLDKNIKQHNCFQRW